MNFVTDLFGLTGKVALVTGGGSGIGRAMAYALARAGAAVVHVGRREEPIEEAARKIMAKGGQAAYSTGDIIQISQLPDLAERAKAFFGPPDILVNAAGANLRESWSAITEESWDHTIDLNLRAPFFLARLLIPAMQARGWGKIINIASLQSVRAFPNGLAYGASKGGVMQLTRAMAEAWSGNQSGITANAIAPGFFRTDLTETLFKDDQIINSLAKQTIIGRNGRLEDLGGVTVFLASPASDYITGQTIFLDGGWTAK